MPRTFMQLTPEKTALFLFGVFFITVLLVIAIAIPHPTESQWRVFNVVLALVASAIAAVLPGALHLEFTPWLKAGGALGVFALVFLVKPTGLVAEDPFKIDDPPAIELAKPVVDRYLSLIDSNKYDEAYSLSSDSFKSNYDRADWIRLGNSLRQPLGSVLERKEVGQRAQPVPFGVRGTLRVYSFQTRFQGAPQLVSENVFVFAKDKKSGWLPAGYEFNLDQSAVGLNPSTGSQK